MRYAQTFMKLYLVTQEVPYLSQTFFERFCWLDSGGALAKTISSNLKPRKPWRAWKSSDTFGWLMKGFESRPVLHMTIHVMKNKVNK